MTGTGGRHRYEVGATSYFPVVKLEIPYHGSHDGRTQLGTLTKVEQAEYY